MSLSDPVDTPEGQITVTISLGVAAYQPNSGLRVEELLSLADKALYRAKDKGRNRVEMA